MNASNEADAGHRNRGRCRVSIAIVLAVFAAASSSCAAFERASGDRSAGTDPERRITALVRAWLSDRRAEHPRVEYRFIGDIRIDPAGEGLYRARFEFDRLAEDDAGTPHIARREHTWIVRDVPDATPVILRIDEQSKLAFPGTGPQIICY
jgi:hypothetical protein